MRQGPTVPIDQGSAERLGDGAIGLKTPQVRNRRAHSFD